MQKKIWTSAAFVAAALIAFPMNSRAGVFLNITIAPPAIPVYEQPVAPGPDYIWTPGYWQWDENVGDYFWVPGTWVAAPQQGYLWTPGYWAFDGGYYGWHAGYWGPHIGYYGGVNYGFGYFGRGFEGGYWNGSHFFYNTAYSRVNVVNVHNVYVHNVTVVNNVHTSFVGGNGLQGRPSPGEQAALRESHLQPTGAQMQHMNFARQDRSQFAGQNHGAPPAAALARPANSANEFHSGAFSGRAGGSYSGRSQQSPSNSQQRGFQGGQQPGQFENRSISNARRGGQVDRGAYGAQGTAPNQQPQRATVGPQPQQDPSQNFGNRPQMQQQPQRPATAPQVQQDQIQRFGNNQQGQQPQPQAQRDAGRQQARPEGRQSQGEARPAGGNHEGGHHEGGHEGHPQ